MTYRVLLVDDEEFMRNLVVRLISKLGYSCVTAVNGIDALTKLSENRFDAVITDIRMPEMDGILLTREISKRYPGVPVMVMTAFDDEYSAGVAISAGAKDFIIKPFSLDEFSVRLHKMIGDSKNAFPLEAEMREDDFPESTRNFLKDVIRLHRMRSDLATTGENEAVGEEDDDEEN